MKSIRQPQHHVPLAVNSVTPRTRASLASLKGLGRCGGGHGNPVQYSSLENPMDRWAWRATVYRVAKSQTQLKRLSAYTHRATDQSVPLLSVRLQSLRLCILGMKEGVARGSLVNSKRHPAPLRQASRLPAREYSLNFRLPSSPVSVPPEASVHLDQVLGFKTKDSLVPHCWVAGTAPSLPQLPADRRYLVQKFIYNLAGVSSADSRGEFCF